MEEMDQIIPWKALSKVIKPYHPKPKGADKRPIGIERMLRIHFLQHWFELLAENGLKTNRGTIVYVPTSTKSKDKARNPDIHQRHKGNQ